MILDVKPTDVLKGTCSLPASKSYSIRAFLIAACGGRSRIVNPSDCDDALVARRVARHFGARLTRQGSGRWDVRADARSSRLGRIDVGESGTVLRFVLPLVAVRGATAVIDGKGTLKGRPNTFAVSPLKEHGVDVRGQGTRTSIPIRMRGKLVAGTFRIDGSLSSQFISGLLIACPQLSTASHLVLKGRKIVSADYITMTGQVLKRSGVRIQKKGLRRYFVSGAQTFRGLKNFTVPSDYGLAAFLMGAALLNRATVTLKGALSNDLIQADGRVVGLLKKMGARFSITRKEIKIKGPQRLRGGAFSLKECPDLVPILAVLALFARGKTRLYNIGHARVKESNRISDLGRELRKIGARVQESKDALVIFPLEKYRAGCRLDPHRDHRLAMAFAVLGTKVGLQVKDIDCVRKSYPGFIRDFRKIGVKARII